MNTVADAPRPMRLLGSPPDPSMVRDYRFFRVCRDDAPEGGEGVPESVALDPAEVAYLLPAR